MLRMGPLRITFEPGPNGRSGVWVEFDVGAAPTFVPREDWVGVDFDGTLARTDNPGHFEPPYPLGGPVVGMVELVQSLLAAGVTVKIFSARAIEPASIPLLQDWSERHGLGRLEVTNQKDYFLIRYYDDRAIQICANHGLSVAAALAQSRPDLLRADSRQHYKK